MSVKRRGAPVKAPLANTDVSQRKVPDDGSADPGQSADDGATASNVVPSEDYDCECSIEAEAIWAFEDYAPGDDTDALMQTVRANRSVCPGCQAWNDYLEGQPDTPDSAALNAASRKLDEAFAAQAANYAQMDAEEQADPRWRVANELLSREQLANLPEPTPVIEGTLFRNTLAVLAGAPGAGKSFVALDWALSIATGTAWHGRTVAPDQRVLYIAAEGVSGLSQRISAWEEARHCKVGNRIRFLPRAHNLLNAVDTQVLADVCSDFAPSLIVIDTLSRSIVGADENSAQEMTRAVDHADRLRTASGAAVVLVHHVAKGTGTPRGSGALVGAADTMYAVTPETRGVIKVQRTKSKDTELDDVILLRLASHGESVALEAVPSLTTSTTSAGATRELLAFTRDTFGTTGATKSELKANCGLPPLTFYRALNTLVKEGLLIAAGAPTRPTYFLADL